MSLEGNLRDLSLPEVCQLLAHTRKSGELRLHSPLSGLSASILFVSGAVVGAHTSATGTSSASEVIVAASGDASLVERTTLDLLCWGDGEFTFVPRPAGDLRSDVRLNTEMLLIEGARRCGEWSRLSDRIPNSRAVPAFVDLGTHQLPLLDLQPAQWEVLTGVDGHRDLSTLAYSLGRELLEVAENVHGLIGAGLLKLVDTARVVRTQATPPSSAALPFHAEGESSEAPEASNQRGPWRVDEDVIRRSTHRDARAPRELGDAAARRGDFGEALHCWRAVLELCAVGAIADADNTDAAHAQEAIALTSRLQELLQVDVQCDVTMPIAI